MSSCGSGIFSRRTTPYCPGLVSDKISSIGRDELMLKGFNPEYVTGCMRMNKRELCYCYDISFVRTPSRIYNLRRIAGKVTCG